MSSLAQQEHKYLVLVVDDDLSMRMLMRASLEKAGFDVAEAENGRQGIEQFQAVRPDAILLDVMMPELDGFETCKALRELPEGEHIPILMVTGLDDVDSIHRAFEVGATDFISKPITWAILAYRVHYMLRSSQAFIDLRHSRSQLAEAQHLAKLGNWEFSESKETFVGSEEFFLILGKPPGCQSIDLEGFCQVLHPDDRENLRTVILGAAEGERCFYLDVRLSPENGEERTIHLRGQKTFLESSRKGMLRGFIQDVTDLRNAEDQIRYLAFYDGLTGLANRELFKDRLGKAMAVGARKKRTMALLFLDLDRFKRINDTLGHHIGDQLLKTIAERLQQCVRESDSIARYAEEDRITCISRLGGDEFTVLLTDLRSPEDAVNVARRIIDAIPKPMTLQGHEVFVTTSIGISVFPHDGDDADTLIKHADTAMYEAKRKGRNNFQFFKESLNEVTSGRLALENDIRKAMQQDEFFLCYQPQVDMQSGEITSAEALIRWRHPERGIVPPGEFIPLAEDLGLIVPLTEWIIHTACQQNRAWQDQGHKPLNVAVNLSGQQFSQQKVAEVTESALQMSGLDARYLEVELTESTLMDNTDVAREVLDHLKALGVNVAIDDFGTGYSSLAYLKSFPIDTLKIDRTFVKDLSTDPDDAAIIRAITAMAKGLELKVVAEGVETEEQLSYLKQLNCDLYQGFLFSRPLPAEEFVELLKN